MAATKMTIIARNNDTGEETVLANVNSVELVIADLSGGRVVDAETGGVAGVVACGVVYIVPPFGPSSSPTRMSLDQGELDVLLSAERASGSFSVSMSKEGDIVSWRNYSDSEAPKAERGLVQLSPLSGTTH